MYHCSQISAFLILEALKEQIVLAKKEQGFITFMPYLSEYSN
jgi:hypothetical protein